ncbi:MAG: aldo/keto reductase [Desulfobacteraceae bacterium]|nr:aldo/keto reductase [Desulfobacteraceae bacterium]
MQYRRLGRTEHKSSVISLGGAALWDVDQEEADAAIQMALDNGVNHFDIAPRYGQAELRTGPMVERYRKKVFLACKTTERSKVSTWESIKRSLDRLHTDYFDLYQLHMVSDAETLNVVMGSGGALEAVVEARDQGLVRYIGITGHRPYVQIEAINRFDFDTVLFPLNRVLAAHPNDYTEFRFLIDTAQKKDIGTITIKAIAKQPWNPGVRMYRTWYEPFTEQVDIDKSIWYTLSQEISTTVLPADLRLWPKVIDAAERFKSIGEREQEAAISEARVYKPIFPSGWSIP